MNTNIDTAITVSPEVWPNAELEVQPGNLDQFVPGGIGLTGPFPLRPWDDPLRDDPGGYYGFEPHSSHPLRGAPVNMPDGGTIYFDSPADDQLLAAGKLMGIRLQEKQYAAFLAEARDSVEERYLVQLRIVSRFALSYLFHAITPEQFEAYPEQPLSVGELLCRFTRDQRDVWGDGMSRQLSGAMGGDGDWAKESLCFGMFVENSYHRVYRIWSRAWLVTK